MNISVDDDLMVEKKSCALFTISRRFLSSRKLPTVSFLTSEGEFTFIDEYFSPSYGSLQFFDSSKSPLCEI